MEKFFDYFDGRYRDTILKKAPSEDGPVITISRLTGCDARLIAADLTDSLNEKYATTKWKWIDKDIIYAIAKELDTDTSRVENFYKGNELSSISEMIMAFSGGFITDLRVKKAIREVVLSMCKEGHLIIVGRGGVSIAHDISNALHVRIVAPFYWRVDNIVKKMGFSLEKAEEYVINSDEKRFNLIQTFMDKKPLNMDSLFDATLNRNSFSVKDLSGLIISMYEKKMAARWEVRKKALL